MKRATLVLAIASCVLGVAALMLAITQQGSEATASVTPMQHPSKKQALRNAVAFCRPYGGPYNVRIESEDGYGEWLKVVCEDLEHQTVVVP